MSGSDYRGASVTCVDCDTTFQPERFNQGPRCMKCYRKQEKAGKWIQWEVKDHTFKFYCDGYSGYSMMSDLAKKVFQHDNFNFVVTGIWGDEFIHGHVVVPLKDHDGPSLSSKQLGENNGSGGMFHGNNHKFTCRSFPWVCVPNKFVKILNLGNPDEQLELF